MSAEINNREKFDSQLLRIDIESMLYKKKKHD